MNQSTSQNTHYLPEWLLKAFRLPVLYELDIFTGKIEQRNPRKAGSGVDLWAADIEDRLSVYDNQAAQIYRNKIRGQPRIALSQSERRDFALWLTHFHTRTPQTRDEIRDLRDREMENPNLVSELLSENRDEFLDVVRAGNPELYDSTLKKYGKAAFEENLAQSAAHRLGGPQPAWLPSPENLWHQYMRRIDADQIASRLCAFDWEWLRSRDGFVIGDNPLVRWHAASRRWNYGIANPGVEITMPLGRNLCLRLVRTGSRHDGHLIDCTDEQTRVYNCRQRLAAIKYVYGGSARALDFITNPIIGWSRNPNGQAG